MTNPEQQASPPPPPKFSAWAPMSLPVFRKLWTVWLIANTCMWMNDVAAAWLMTSLTTSPVMVALVQTASTLPMFLLGLPSGAMADIIDRRRYLMTTQFWIAGTATLLSLAVLSGGINAPLLLALTFANGIGLAMRWPAYSATIPELVPRPQLPQALALNGVAMNASRIVGPIVAGMLIAGAGTAWVFALNAALSIVAGFTLMSWRRERTSSALPGERFLGAMRVGIQHVRQSRPMRTVLLRISIFFGQSTALLALLPLVAKRMPDGSAGTYTLLLASTGLGAVLSIVLIPRWRRSVPHDAMIRRGTLVQAAMTIVVAFAPNLWVALPAMIVNGIAWLTVANTIGVSAQMALPNWVRARGMSMYQMALMGSSAIGAALWGQVASLTDVGTSMVVAALTGSAALWLTRHRTIAEAYHEDLTPSKRWKPPQTDPPTDPNAGPVFITIEYLIDPARAAEFNAVMQETRRRRLGQGALSWGLLRDTAVSGRYVEYIVDESWVEHLRRFDRFTAADEALRARRLDFHLGDAAPLISRFVGEPMSRS